MNAENKLTQGVETALFVLRTKRFFRNVENRKTRYALNVQVVTMANIGAVETETGNVMFAQVLGAVQTSRCYTNAKRIETEFAENALGANQESKHLENVLTAQTQFAEKLIVMLVNNFSFQGKLLFARIVIHAMKENIFLENVPTAITQYANIAQYVLYRLLAITLRKNAQNRMTLFVRNNIQKY